MINGKFDLIKIDMLGILVLGVNKQICMNFVEFNKIFQSHVFALTHEKQCQLAISVCKKLYQDYQDFYQENKWGDPDILLDSINLCQLYIAKQIDVSSLKEILPKVDKIIPDTEDFENSSYALNAGATVYETLEFLIDKDQKHILNIGTYLTDTMNSKIQEDDDLTEQQIINHPMMLEARKFLISG